MHLTFVATGIMKDIREFEKWWETRTMWAPVNYKDGRKLKAPIESQLREIKLYDLIFPKEELDIVLNTLNKNQFETTFTGSTGTLAGIGFLRNRLHLKKIPEWDKTKGMLHFPKLNVRTFGIGIREDIDIMEKDPDGKEVSHEAI